MGGQYKNKERRMYSRKEIFNEILKSPIYQLVKKTPLEKATFLSKDLANEIFLKREDLHPTFSFKVRGAYNKISFLLAQEKKIRPVICASAGNHAQGLAFVARHFGLKSIVVMPKTSPKIKIDAVRALGAKIILSGHSFQEAQIHCKEICKQEKAWFVHPFDDPLVIAGQGTIGKELLEDCHDLDMVFVPVGGGGLAAGIATYLKELCPKVKVIGVEPEESASMLESIKAGKRLTLKETGTFADGVAVAQVGKLPYKICKEILDQVITVSNDALCSAIADIHRETRTLVEPAGALSIAGIKKYLAKNSKLQGKKIIALTCGANMSFRRLQFIAERASIGAEQELLLLVKLQERPGTLEDFCIRVLRDRTVSEFNYRYFDQEKADIFLGIQVESFLEKQRLEKKMAKHNYDFQDLTDNDLAKDHIRHMIGGRSKQVSDEILFRLHFPDRPNALIELMKDISTRWNISLFHFRSHGADFNRALLGIQLPKKEKEFFIKQIEKKVLFLKEETNNPAYQHLLTAS